MNKIINMDCIQGMKQLPDKCVDTCVTSPPYFGLRDYGIEGQIGLEDDPKGFVSQMIGVFSEVKRVLKDEGTLWLNLGDTYAANRSYQVPPTNGGKASGVNGKGSKVPEGLKQKDLIGIPWRVAFALQASGWYLRQDIIWHKPNPMPESMKDRCTKSHEYIFLLSKSPKYYFDHKSISEETVAGGGVKNKRDVWSVNVSVCREAHFATFPPELIRPCVLAGAPSGGLVLDPFMGAGTTGMVAKQEGRNYVGFELNPEYVKIAERRIAGVLSRYSEEEVIY